MVSIHTGKKQMTTARAILLCGPNPSQPMNNGARTIFGSACTAIAYGVIAVRMNGTCQGRSRQEADRCSRSTRPPRPTSVCRSDRSTSSPPATSRPSPRRVRQRRAGWCDREADPGAQLPATATRRCRGADPPVLLAVDLGDAGARPAGPACRSHVIPACCGAFSASSANSGVSASSGRLAARTACR